MADMATGERWIEMVDVNPNKMPMLVVDQHFRMVLPLQFKKNNGVEWLLQILLGLVYQFVSK